MKLKSFIYTFFFALCMTAVAPVFAGTGPGTEVPKEVRAKQIEARLYEIKNMDKTNLTSADKKELRKEVKDLRKEAKSRGIYLSIGAIIIIILLLILILN